MIEIPMLLIGVIGHWAKKLMQMRQETGKMIGPVEAFRAKPYHIVKVTLTALAGGFAMYDMGLMNPASAFLFGYFADSAPSALKRRIKQ